MITIAHTSAGRKKLAETLSLKTDHLNEMDKRYEAITELGKKTSFLVDFEASSERILEKREKALQRRLDFEDEDEDNDSDDEKKSGKEAAGEENPGCTGDPGNPGLDVSAYGSCSCNEYIYSSNGAFRCLGTI